MFEAGVGREFLFKQKKAFRWKKYYFKYCVSQKNIRKPLPKAKNEPVNPISPRESTKNVLAVLFEKTPIAPNNYTPKKIPRNELQINFSE